MTDLTDLVLTGVLSYGAPALSLILLTAAIGVPLPTTLLLVAGGAFVRQGLMDPFLAVGLALLGAVAGDSISYGMGHYAGGWVEGRWGNSTPWQSARNDFQRRGGLSIYLTRFLITSLALPVNLVAGSTRYGYRRFLPLVVAGELTWVILFGALGYAFGSQWEAVSQFVSDFGGLLVGIVALGAGIYLAVRFFRR